MNYTLMTILLLYLKLFYGRKYSLLRDNYCLQIFKNCINLNHSARRSTFGTELHNFFFYYLFKMPTDDNKTPTTNAILCYHVTFTVPWSVNISVSTTKRLLIKNASAVYIFFFKAPLASSSNQVSFTNTSIYQV